jgi:hypothetical protein
MSDPSRIDRAARRYAIPGIAFALAVVGVAYGLRSCAQDQRNQAYLERKAPLAKSFAKHRSLLARAAALQPNFKELTLEIAPSRCRELRDLVRARYELDPFRVKARCKDEVVTAELDICEGARAFADLGGAESQHGQKIGVILQSRKRLEVEGAARLEVVTLLLADDHSILEMHKLSFEGDSMSAKPTSTIIRALGSDGLLERSDRGDATELRATTLDGAVQLFREEKGKKEPVVERVRGAGTTGWTKAQLLPTTGAWYGTPDGVTCAPPSWSELEIDRLDGSVTCTWVRAYNKGSLQEWPRGDGCDSGT